MMKPETTTASDPPTATVPRPPHPQQQQQQQQQHQDNNTTIVQHENDANATYEDEDESRRRSWVPVHWLSKVALLGDSTLSLVVAFMLLLMAVIIQQQPQHSNTTTMTSVDHKLPPPPPLDPQVVADWGRFTTYESLGPLPEEIVLERMASSSSSMTNTNPPQHHPIYQVNHHHDHDHHDHDDISPPPAPPTHSLMITPQMIHDYHRDGVVAMRGLISPALLQRLDDETAHLIASRPSSSLQQRQKQQQQQFHTVLHAAMFRPIPHHHDNNTGIYHSNQRNSNNDTENTPSALMEVALWSSVSVAAAALLQLSSNETLRVIRDIFLAKDDGPYVCGWHVDDFGFWPALPQQPQPTSLSHEGINAWIALDDMIMTEETGGFALAVQSHTAIWNYTAYNITGAPTIQNVLPGGYHNVSHMFQQRIGYGTCHMERTAPHIHERLEEMKRIYPVRRGDVIFHTRYLFHRTVPISTKSSSHNHNDSSHTRRRHVYRRYSIRYGQGSTTIIPPGYGTELSVLYEPRNGGRSVEEICTTHDRVPWYPRAVPHIPPGRLREELYQAVTTMQQHHLPMAEERLALRKQEMKPYLRRLALQK